VNVIGHDDIPPDDPRRFIAPTRQQEFGDILAGQDRLAGRGANRQEDDGWLAQIFMNMRVRRITSVR
jgi:hypothetical protein